MYFKTGGQQSHSLMLSLSSVQTTLNKHKSENYSTKYPAEIREKPFLCEDA